MKSVEQTISRAVRLYPRPVVVRWRDEYQLDELYQAATDVVLERDGTSTCHGISDDADGNERKWKVVVA